MIEVTPHTVVKVGQSEYCMVLLKETNGQRLLPVWMRVHRAQPIVLWMNNLKQERPRTHDLFVDVVEKLGVSLAGVTIYGMESGALLCRIMLHHDDEEITLECRASDAIAVAIAKGVPIRVADEIMAAAGFTPRSEKAQTSATMSEEDVDRELSVFKDFIDGLDLDDL